MPALLIVSCHRKELQRFARGKKELHFPGGSPRVPLIHFISPYRS